jgi:hypothetical protein
MKTVTRVICALLAAGLSFAQPGGRGMAAPKPGVCPLPVLPALPGYDDASFFARKDVPHGALVQATYQNYAAAEKRMHVYLPPG